MGGLLVLAAYNQRFGAGRGEVEFGEFVPENATGVSNDSANKSVVAAPSCDVM